MINVWNGENFYQNWYWPRFYFPLFFQNTFPEYSRDCQGIPGTFSNILWISMFMRVTRPNLVLPTKCSISNTLIKNLSQSYKLNSIYSPSWEHLSIECCRDSQDIPGIFNNILTDIEGYLESFWKGEEFLSSPCSAKYFKLQANNKQLRAIIIRSHF